MSTAPTLSSFERTLVGYVTSILNESWSLAVELRRRLTAGGASRWLLDNIRDHPGRWTVSDDDRIDVLVDYAVRLTRRPGSIGAADIERLRSIGLDGRGIFELNHVVAAYGYSNRVVAGLGIDAATPELYGLVGSSGGAGTVIAGASTPPSMSKTLPVTHDDASDTR
jgi:uncharacterized peroxidase-related enzyme